MEIGDRIKARRLQLGLTLKEIAEPLGVKEATLQRYESGNIKNIKHDTIADLAKILKVTPAHLMGWNEEEPVDDELKKENLKIFNSLTEDKKHQALDFLRFLQGK